MRNIGEKRNHLLKKMKQSGLVINKELSEQNENLKRNIEDFLNEFQEYSGY